MKKSIFTIFVLAISVFFSGCIGEKPTDTTFNVNSTKPNTNVVNVSNTTNDVANKLGNTVSQTVGDWSEEYDVDTEGYPYYPVGHTLHRKNAIRYYPVGHALHNAKTMPKTRPNLKINVDNTNELPKVRISRSNPAVMEDVKFSSRTASTTSNSIKSTASATTTNNSNKTASTSSTPYRSPSTTSSSSVYSSPSSSSPDYKSPSSSSYGSSSSSYKSSSSTSSSSSRRKK